MTGKDSLLLGRLRAHLRCELCSGAPVSTYCIDRQGRIACTAIGGREFDHPDIERTVRTLRKL